MTHLPSLTTLSTILSLCLLSCGGSQTLVFLGDSITKEGDRSGGYIDLIRKDLRNTKDSTWHIIGAGISGNKVPDLEARLDRDVLAHDPTLVIIYIGINDVWHYKLGIGGTPKDRYEAGLKDLCKRIRAAGGRIVLCTPSVVGEKYDGTNPLDTMLDEHAAITRAVAAETGSTLCDLRRAFLEELKKRNTTNTEKGILTRDGVHLNDAGNRFVATQILHALK